jgi:hypothetical protein
MAALQTMLTTAWLGPLLWAALYISDYVLTLTCAGLYRSQGKIVFEGSYEITPVYQADVDALRKVSPRFVAALVLSTAYIWLVRSIAAWVPELQPLYIGMLGAMLLIQLTVHVRHLRNWFTFSRGIHVIDGRLVYPRRFLLMSSAFELLLFAGLYLGLFLLTGSVFVLGGSLGCGILSIKHYQLARRQPTAPIITT